jgi:Na+-transporting NADH:ubiquinone oxidoreductase subunit A
VLVRTKKGLDLRMAGQPAPEVEPGRAVRSVALLGTDYRGLKPQMLVQPGDPVEIGQPLFVDKRDPEVQYTAPGSGTVVEVNRGARRALQSVVIELSGDDGETSTVPSLVGVDPERLDADRIRRHLCSTGLWTAFRTRPFDRVPLSTSTPRAIFVTAIDTRPLAADPQIIVARQSEAFATGLRVLSALTSGPVYLCTAPQWSGPIGDAGRVRHVRFEGPHPAGLPGTHIHHLDPVGPERTVWHIGYQDVIATGRLFGGATLSLERCVALGGTLFSRPRILTTRLGASLNDLLAKELDGEGPDGQRVRILRGSVLYGSIASGVEAYLGRYDQQVCAVRENGERKLFGWAALRSNAPSFVGALAGRSRGAAREYTTALGGQPGALLPLGAFERLVPMDIVPVPLLRALLIGDSDQAQALGCLELDAEDLSLCTFVCPGKNDYGAVLTVNLEQLEREG